LAAIESKMIMTSSPALRVALFSPNQRAISETFIHAHIERLPFTVIPHYGHGWSLSDQRGQSLWRWGHWIAATAKLTVPRLERWLLTHLLAWRLKRLKIDAVLAEYGTTGALIMPACARAGIPLFVHFHGFDASVHTVLVEHHQGYQHLFAHAAGVVAVSQVMHNRLLALGADPARLHLNPYGVDPEKFSGAQPEQSPPVFLAVGRFVEKKAPYLTLLAFKQVLHAVPAARLIMIGAGPLLGPCRRLADALGIAAAVELRGAQPASVVMRLMREVRAFVQHSLEAETGDCEGTPVGIIEAQMSGLPVIATRHAGIPDVVIDQATGFLVAEGDAQAMAERMILVAEDAARAGELGRAGRNRAVELFTMERHIHQLAEMIRQGVGGGVGRV
jgi:glycosyltransferase involved in cell wall biosynthesis